MKPGGGKGKGNKYELLIAKKFSKWAIGRSSPVVLWRIKDSGARATRMQDKETKLIGDIMAIAPEGQFLTQIVAIEAKDRKTANVLDFFHSKEDDDRRIMGWWADICRKAGEAGLEPLLVFHPPGKKFNYVLMTASLFNTLDNWLHAPKEVIFFKININSNSPYVYNGILMYLDDFFSWVKPWELASCYLDDEIAKKVEDYYGKFKRKKNRAGSIVDNTTKAVRGNKGKRKLIGKHK